MLDKYPRPLPEREANKNLQLSMRARGKLYEVIILFRQNAKETTDPQARMIFLLAAEMIAALTKIFKMYESRD